MDGLRPDREDVDRFRQNQKRKVTSSAGNERWEAPVSKVSKPAAPSSSTTLVVVLLLIVGVAIVGASYWLYEQQAQQLERLKGELTEASELIKQSKLSLARFEGELTETGQEMEASEGNVQKKLDFLESEIRKLWGVSYDRNRKAISKTEEDLEKAKGQLSGLNSTQDKLLKRVDGLFSQAGKIQKQADGLQDVVSSQSSVLEGLSKSQSRVDADLRQFQDDLASTRSNLVADLSELRTQVENLSKTGSLDERIAKTERAIEAIDATRLQLNQRFVTLERRVNDTQLELKAHLANPLVPK